MKLGEADDNSEKKQGGEFWKILRTKKSFLEQSAAQTMAKSAKTSLKNAILCFVNRAAAELAGIVSPTR